MRVALLIPAAGSGSRLGFPVPKALVDVAGVPLVRRTLERVAAGFSFVETVVLVPPQVRPLIEAALADAPAALGTCIVRPGGATRQESVCLGLQALASDADFVCVHDAARPLVSAATVRAVIGRAAACGAATAAARPSDSVRIDEGERSRALDRGRLWLVETPQAFRRELLVRAHEVAAAAHVHGTDDACLVEAIGHRIEIVETEGTNLKVTVETDLLAVIELLRRRSQ